MRNGAKTLLLKKWTLIFFLLLMQVNNLYPMSTVDLEYIHTCLEILLLSIDPILIPDK